MVTSTRSRQRRWGLVLLVVGVLAFAATLLAAFTVYGVAAGIVGLVAVAAGTFLLARAG